MGSPKTCTFLPTDDSKIRARAIPAIAPDAIMSGAQAHVRRRARITDFGLPQLEHCPRQRIKNGGSRTASFCVAMATLRTSSTPISFAMHKSQMHSLWLLYRIQFSTRRAIEGGLTRYRGTELRPGNSVPRPSRRGLAVLTLSAEALSSGGGSHVPGVANPGFSPCAICRSMCSYILSHEQLVRNVLPEPPGRTFAPSRCAYIILRLYTHRCDMI